MEEKFLMENVLFANRVINDLYLHGTMESSNDSVMNAFYKGIQETLKMHNELYKAMAEAGFYQVQNITEDKISQTLSKLECTCKDCDCEEDD